MKNQLVDYKFVYECVSRFVFLFRCFFFPILYPFWNCTVRMAQHKTRIRFDLRLPYVVVSFAVYKQKKCVLSFWFSSNGLILYGSVVRLSCFAWSRFEFDRTLKEKKIVFFHLVRVSGVCEPAEKSNKRNNDQINQLPKEIK